MKNCHVSVTIPRLVFLFLENTTPTANRTAEKQVHVEDACFSPLPLTTTENERSDL